jgi:hypothetical protein
VGHCTSVSLYVCVCVCENGCRAVQPLWVIYCSLLYSLLVPFFLSRSCAISSLGSVSHVARPIGTERRRDNKLPWCGTNDPPYLTTNWNSRKHIHASRLANVKRGWRKNFSVFYSFPLWFEFGRVLLDGKSKVLFPIYLHKLYTTAISNSLLHHLLIRLFISLENKT